MMQKPTPIPLSRRVMPSIIADDIKGVSPMVGPVMETARMITERQGEGQVDIDVDPETARQTTRADLGDLPIERAAVIIEQIKPQPKA